MSKRKIASHILERSPIIPMIFQLKYITADLLLFLLFLNSFSELRAQKSLFYLQQPYLEAGIGMSPFTNTKIARASRNRMPILGYLELGKIKKRLALNLSYSFNESHAINNYSYCPKYITALLKPYFLSISHKKSFLEVFGLLGSNWANTSLIDVDNSQVITYENKKETDQVFGPCFGIGIQYVQNHLVYRIQWLNIISKTRFFAGGFEKTDFMTGSNQIQVAIGYRLKKQIEKKRNEKLCSTYQ
ncbi:MAG: hypothetical protein ABJH72_08570 [Reichenbachiella sp.]|uniref:hypothetical protein n=1 Tax=Reichenbachiella sp. TaxID=2184521 RepID=UPI003298646A